MAGVGGSVRGAGQGKGQYNTQRVEGAVGSDLIHKGWRGQ